MAVPRQRDWNLQEHSKFYSLNQVAMAVPRQRDWNVTASIPLAHAFLSCNGCPSTEGLKPFENKRPRNGLDLFSCNGCPSTEGLKPDGIRKGYECCSNCCNGCPSTEGLKQIRVLFQPKMYPRCNGCPSTEGLKLRLLYVFNHTPIKVAMAVPRQRDWTFVYLFSL